MRVGVRGPKIDLQSAYRYWHNHTHELWMYGKQWDGRGYLDCRTQFGDASMVQDFSRFTDYFLWLLRKLRDGDERLRSECSSFGAALWGAIGSVPTSKAYITASGGRIVRMWVSVRPTWNWRSKPATSTAFSVAHSARSARRRCATSRWRVPNHEQVKPHSFRIAGATLLFSVGVTADEIKAMGRWASGVYRTYSRLSKGRLLDLPKRMSNASSTQFLNGTDGFMELLEVEPVEAEAPPSGPDDDRQPDPTEEDEAETGDEADEREAELADDDSDFDDEVGDGDDSVGSDTKSAVMSDCGPLLTDAQVSVGASVAVPFSLDGRQVHFEGIISSMTSSSKVYVAFPGERSWLVARDRLFEVVALSACGKQCDHDATCAARVSTLGRDDDDDMAI